MQAKVLEKIVTTQGVLFVGAQDCLADVRMRLFKILYRCTVAALVYLMLMIP